MDLLPAVLIPVAVSLAIGFLTRSASQVGKAGPNGITLGYGLPFKLFACFAIALSLAALTCILFVESKDRLPMVGIALIFAIPGIPLFLQAFVSRIVYSDQGIETISPLRKRRFFAWSDISAIRYGYQQHRLEATSGETIRLPGMLSGVPALLDEAHRRGIRSR